CRRRARHRHDECAPPRAAPRAPLLALRRPARARPVPVGAARVRPPRRGGGRPARRLSRAARAPLRDGPRSKMNAITRSTLALVAALALATGCHDRDARPVDEHLLLALE